MDWSDTALLFYSIGVLCGAVGAFIGPLLPGAQAGAFWLLSMALGLFLGAILHGMISRRRARRERSKR